MPKFFVYELIDPRDGDVFYVGKGQGNRPREHIYEAKRGVLSHKCAVIRKILALGLEVSWRIVREFRSEDAAYSFEKKHIAAIGLEKLTNATPGGRSPFPSKPSAKKEIRILNHCWSKLICATADFNKPARFRIFGKWHEISIEHAKELQEAILGELSKLEKLDGARA